MAISPDEDNSLFKITTEVLLKICAPFLFIICLNYILRNSIDCNSELGLTITERKSTIYPVFNITDAYYVDDIAITTNKLRDVNVLLHIIDRFTK